MKMKSHLLLILGTIGEEELRWLHKKREMREMLGEEVDSQLL